jgi:hypothetical protein
MGRWTAIAEGIAEDIREPGFGAAATVASAWCARVDPGVTRGLVNAAVILTDGDALTALWAPLPPCPDAATLLRWGEELESHIGELHKRCTDAGKAARGEHDDAVTAWRDAATGAREAAARIASASGSARPARAAAEAALDAAREQERDARRVAVDCESALDLLGMVDGKLRYSLDCVRKLPAELDETYEAAGRHVADGKKLPHSGDFIAPGHTPEMISDGTAA